MYFVPHDEAIRLTDSPQTRMKPGFVRNQVYCSYNNFTTNENPWMKRYGTAGTLAVSFCYNDADRPETVRYNENGSYIQAVLPKKNDCLRVERTPLPF